MLPQLTVESAVEEEEEEEEQGEGKEIEEEHKEKGGATQAGKA